jgi:hypothetical protein
LRLLESALFLGICEGVVLRKFSALTRKPICGLLGFPAAAFFGAIEIDP